MVMKTYLLETLNRYKRFSESLDAKAVLSNKAWVVFNDEGEKQVYIFQGMELYFNCEVRIEHDDIYFTYQNEKFMIEASNESAFITIWDLWHYGICCKA